MLRLRLFASFLSMLTLAGAVWAWIETASWAVCIALVVAAVCLGIVVPFDAPGPRRRTRVVIAALAYVTAAAAAIILAYAAASGMLISALSLLAELGIALTCWAIATRNRSRMSGVQRYYDS